MALVTVLRDPFRRSWPELDANKPVRPDEDRVYLLDRGGALEREFRTDAHFAAYVSPTRYRCNSETLARVPDGVEMAMLCFDFDGPDHGATPEWRRENRERVQTMLRAHSGGYFYETRNGSRLLYQLPAPVRITSTDDARRWRQNYIVGCVNIKRRFGLNPDQSCGDWQRLFRLPHATRDEGGKPENHPSFGDPHAIGALHIEASTDDVRLAHESIHFRKAKDIVSTASPRVRDGRGLFFYLLQGRNMLTDRERDGGRIVICPNRSAHGKCTDGRSSTVLYPPSPGDELGLILCKHDHCQIHTRDWLALFSEQEIAAAREAAGVSERGRAA